LPDARIVAQLDTMSSRSITNFQKAARRGVFGLNHKFKLNVSLHRAAFFVVGVLCAFAPLGMAQTNVKASAALGVDPAQQTLAAAASESVTFDAAEITGRWVDSWEEKGVVFTPAHAPTKSKAKARLMFFPHAPSGRKGILSAMADDPIPVRAGFTNGCSSVTISFWGSTGCPARLEAYNSDGQLLDKTGVEKIPGRKVPGEPIPTFELTVRGTNIAYIEFSGPRAGEYLVAEEVRFTPIRATDK
jgi:hypothetical protein